MENSSKSDYIDLSNDGGVLKKIELEGFGEVPPEGSEVTLQFEGKIDDGRIIENTRIRQDAYSVILGKSTIPKGLEIAIKSMKIAERSRVKVRSDYGYGPNDVQLSIPPKPLKEMEEAEAKKYSNIEYEVEIIKHDKVRKPKEQMEFDERISESLSLKEEGNQLFKKKRFREAIIRYNDGLQYLTQIPTDFLTEKIIEIKSQITLNVVNCHIHLFEYNYGLKKVLDAFHIKITPKAYFYRSICYMHQNDFELAENDLKSLEKLLPGEKLVENAWNEFRDYRQKYEKNKKSLFKKGLIKTSLYEDKKIVENKIQIYPYNNEKDHYVFIDISVSFDKKNFRDTQKIKIEIFSSLFKPISEKFFEKVVKGLNGGLKIKKYLNGLICGLKFDFEYNFGLVNEQGNFLPINEPGLLILDEYNEVFINLNTHENIADNKNLFVFGRIIFNQVFISKLSKSLENITEFNDNYVCDVVDSGKSLFH